MHPPSTRAVEIDVRFSDLDAYGHVNNAVFFTYLETARTRLFLDRFIDFANNGLLFLVAKAECEYKQPINLGNRVVVDMHIERFGNSSFDLVYRLHDGDDTTYATARTIMVCFDQKQNRTVAVPAALKTVFA